MEKRADIKIGIVCENPCGHSLLEANFLTMTTRAGHRFCDVCETSIRSTLWEAHIKSKFHLDRIPKEMQQDTPPSPANVVGDAESSASDDEFDSHTIIPVDIPPAEIFHVAELKEPVEVPESDDKMLSEFQAEINQLEQPDTQQIPADRRSELQDLISEGVARKRPRSPQPDHVSDEDSEDDWRKGRIS